MTARHTLLIGPAGLYRYGRTTCIGRETSIVATLDAVRPLLNGQAQSLHRTYVGSGAVLFDLHAAGRLRCRDVVLSDPNPRFVMTINGGCSSW
jgi:hypothetical protein